MADYSLNINTGYNNAQTTAPSGQKYTLNKDSSINSYNQLIIWQADEQAKIEENVLQSLADADFETQEEWDEALETNYTEALNNAGSFSFVQEGDSYGEQIETLAQEHLEAYDTIEADGKISIEEFKQGEITEYNAFSDEDNQIDENSEPEMQMFEAAFNFMDLNNDSVIDADEIKAYYTIADILDDASNPPENAQDALDGNINFASLQTISDLMSAEDTNCADRNSLRAAMNEIYEANNSDGTKDEGKKDIKIDTQDEGLFYEAQEPSTTGKITLAIEDRILNENPFEIDS